MRFAEWIEDSKRTQAQIASDLDVSQAHVSMLASGKKRPSAGLIARIQQISDERVRLNDWYPSLALTPAIDTVEREVLSG